MLQQPRRQWTAVGALLLVLTGCGATATPRGQDAPGATDVDALTCAPYRQYGRFPGQRISVFSSALAPEDRQYSKSFGDFEKCTGAVVDFEGSNDFEVALATRVDGGYPPDLALIPQPGLVATLVKKNAIRPLPASVVKSVTQYWSKDWIRYGTVNGKLYAAPSGANVKSLVWYSPKFFSDNGLTPPKTWAEMITLSDRLTHGNLKGAGPLFKPWCAGFGSGAASGWPGTDWIEDIMLRTAGPAVYDDWMAHRIPFDDPRVVAAFTQAGQILRNAKYVNGGTDGGVASIATVTFQSAGLPVMSNQCAMHRQASFYGAQWPKGTNVGPKGEVFAFPLPQIVAGRGATVLGAGDFMSAFNDRPVVQAFQAFLVSPEWANARAAQGGWFSASKGLKVSSVDDNVQKEAALLLQNPATVFRFDASDMMPAQVGAGTFWKGMMDWIRGGDPQKVTATIEASWPKS